MRQSHIARRGGGGVPQPKQLEAKDLEKILAKTAGEDAGEDAWEDDNLFARSFRSTQNSEARFVDKARQASSKL
jgi:hypothetical protein